MATVPSPPPAAPALPRQITVVSHSGLFYWWPVWAVGFLMALLTYLHDTRFAVLPPGTSVKEVSGRDFALTLVQPPTESLKQAVELSKAGQDAFPLRTAANKNFGIVFSIILLLVIFITNVPLRGLWSVLALLLILLVTVLLALFDLWDPILEAVGRFHVHISLAGYLFPALVLFVAWCVTVFIFDHRRYIIFAPGQMRVHKDIGDAEQVFDTTGLTFQKQRSDLFRHWVLGLGSGDLILNTSGAQATHIEMPNVLFIGSKLRVIADLMKERPVVESQG